MLPELREALRRLCCSHGWSYALLWSPDRCDSQLLVMEECYHEGEAADVVDGMRRKLHLVGEGTIGEAAVSGKHQWIYSDTCCIDSSPASTDDNLDIWQGNAEWQHQFISGIKTIAIISLPSFGVVQCGSSQKISENPEFVDQVQSLFWNQEAVDDQFLDMDLPDTHATLASLIYNGNAYSSSNINFLRDDVRNAHMATQQSTCPLLPSTFFSRGSSDDVDSHVIRTDPRVLAMPVISSSTAVSKGFSNSISWESLFHLTNQYQAVDHEAQASISPNTCLQSASRFPQNSFTNFNGSMWQKEVFSSPQLLETAICRSPSMLHTRSSLPGPHVNEFCHFGGDSREPCRPHESSSSFPIFTGRSFSEEHSFVSELPEMLFSSSKDSTPEHSKLLNPRDGQLSVRIQSSDKPLELLSDVLTMPMNENLLSVRCKPSGLADSESVGCPQSSEFLSRLADSISANVVNSMETDPKWKAHLPDTPTQLLSDNELFDGMELDLIPSFLEQYQWNDIILPGGSGTCSNFTSISDSITGSIEGGAKWLYSKPTHGQLLDAVVAGNAITSSSSHSAATNADSVACLNSKHQYPKITKPSDSQILRNPVPLLGQPTFNRASDMSLPEFSLDKIIQACPNESFPKSIVSSWMDNSCSMNSGSSIINQSKKPEDAGKVVRKRARPGESTRPRPKDRQQIQDCVKELREIVPNCAKCSIDSLLDRTIKHMLFLQSLTKYTDKIKQADEPKMIGNESCVVLKDNFSSGGGGATWAYEVAGQTMVCPILIEDLNPPGQMLVEMLCEDRGFFLEIAEIIRGFGLTILKGVMEVHDSKIWARFLVEANRDITRMDIFLSLVQLLQQTSCIQSADQRLKATNPTFTNSEQSPAAAIAVGLAGRTQ